MQCARHSHLTPLYTFFLTKNPKQLATFFAYPDRAQLFRCRIECAIAELHAAACTTRVIRLHSARRLSWHHRVVICVELCVCWFAYSDRAHRALSSSAANSRHAHTNMSRKFAIFAFAGCSHPPTRSRNASYMIISSGHVTVSTHNDSAARVLSASAYELPPHFANISRKLDKSPCVCVRYLFRTTLLHVFNLKIPKQHVNFCAYSGRARQCASNDVKNFID